MSAAGFASGPGGSESGGQRDKAIAAATRALEEAEGGTSTAELLKLAAKMRFNTDARR